MRVAVPRARYAVADPMSGQRSESSRDHRTPGQPATTGSAAEKGRSPARRPRVGLVLGGGGILGGAWLVGALYALTQAAGFDPAAADYIVGTSAGSVVGAL